MLDACPTSGNRPTKGLDLASRMAQLVSKLDIKGKAMRGSFKLISAGLLLALAPAAQAQVTGATQTATGQLDKAYSDLFDTVTGAADLDVLSRNAAGDIFDSLVRNRPDFAEKAATKPGLRDRFIAACEPYLKLWTPRSLNVVRQRSAAELAKIVTPADARQLITFYASPLGRKTVKMAAGSLTFNNLADATMQGKAVAEGYKADRAEFDRNLRSASGEFVESLTPAERREFQAFMQTSAFKKLDAMNSALARITPPGENEISTPEERQAFTNVIVKFFTDEFGPR